MPDGGEARQDVPSVSEMIHDEDRAPAFAKCLAKVPGLEVAHYPGGWPDNEKAFQGASGIFLYADGGGGHPFIQQDHLAVIGDFMGRGVGLLCAHYAVEVPKEDRKSVV